MTSRRHGAGWTEPMQPPGIRIPNLGIRTREWVDEHFDLAQPALASCKQNNLYPECLCRSPHPRYYIAQRHRYYLARMPNTGPDHAPFCPTYEPESSLCGRGIYTNEAMRELPDGRISVKVNFPILVRDPQGPIEPNHPEVNEPPVFTSASDHPVQQSTGLKGLLDLLWETARFNRYSPHMHNRRRYRQVYKYTCEAAEKILVRRRALNDLLFIPEPYDRERSLDIAAKRTQTLRRLSRSARGAPLRVLTFGEVRDIAFKAKPPYLTLKHLPRSYTIRCNESTIGQLERNTNHALLNFPNSTIHEDFHILVLLTMVHELQGSWKTEQLASLVTSREYIPVRSVVEARFVHKLVEEQRYFYKPLQYDSRATYPNFFLTSATDRIPIEILPQNQIAQEAMIQRLATYREDRLKYFYWNPAENPEVPHIPFRDPQPVEGGAPEKTPPNAPPPEPPSDFAAAHDPGWEPPDEYTESHDPPPEDPPPR